MQKFNIPFGDLGRQYKNIKTEIDEAVHRVLDSGWYVLGKELENFEEQFAQYANSPFAIGVGSGTEALHLALVAAGVKSGDKVLTVPNTAVPTLSAISFAAAEPVFVDVDPKTYCMDVNLLESKITAKTKAIIPVHLYGQACNMTAIMDVARKRNIKVVEDCAQAHGSTWAGQNVGTFGDFGAFSFYPSKNLGALGDAGLVVTQNEENAQQLRFLRNYGQTERYYHKVKGFNSRLDELQAAILAAKLNFMEQWTNRRREIAQMFNENIKHDEIEIPKVAADAFHVYHLYVVRTDRRPELREYLQQNGIGTQIHYPVPCHSQQAYQYLGNPKGSFPVAEKYAEQVLSLPNYPELSDEEILYICDVLNRF